MQKIPISNMKQKVFLIIPCIEIQQAEAMLFFDLLKKRLEKQNKLEIINDSKQGTGFEVYKDDCIIDSIIIVENFKEKNFRYNSFCLSILYRFNNIPMYIASQNDLLNKKIPFHLLTGNAKVYSDRINKLENIEENENSVLMVEQNFEFVEF